MKATTKPSEFQVTCNELLEALRPLRHELASLSVEEAEAIRKAELDKVRQIKARRREIHEELLSKAGEGKRQLQAFLDAFVPVAEAERQRVDADLAAKKSAREKLDKEYQKRALELDREIAQAEKTQHVVWSNLQAITELQITTSGVLAEQINESLQAA